MAFFVGMELAAAIVYFFYIILNSFKKQERIPKDAALWYKEVIKINKVIKINGECLNIHDDRRV